MSMVDTILMHHLLKAVRLDTTLIMVGDVNQMPSVGAGNVLKDIISSGAVPVTELTEIFRQARESSIMLQRNLIYTGITRGKKLVVMIGSKKALAIGVKNAKTQQRYTFLEGRLLDN